MKNVIQVTNKRNVTFNVVNNDGVIEFYDVRNNFDAHGQFVSAYYLDTILECEGGLNMDGCVFDWVITKENVETIKKWLTETV